MAFNLGGIKSSIGGAGNGLNVGGLLNGNFSIGGTFNSLNQKAKIDPRPNSELKELYEPTNKVTLQYPMDLDNVHYLMFNVQRRFPINEDENAPQTTTKTYQTIVLPIPVNLADSRSVEYNNANLGVLGGLGAGQITGQQAYRDLSMAVQTFGGQALKTATSNITGLIDSIIGEIGTNTGQAAINLATVGGTAYAMRNLGIGGLTGAAAALKFGQGVLYSQGKAYNPRAAILFNTVNFRDFTFNYRLIARNPTESQQITDIVRAFQTYMLPSYFGESNSGFNYPLEFGIEFAKPLQQHLFTFHPCVLKNVNVTYNGDTGPAFFEGTNAPMIVDLSLQFQETKILTRNRSADEIVDEQYFKDLADMRNVDPMTYDDTPAGAGMDSGVVANSYSGSDPTQY